VELVEGGGGVFDVVCDGELVFSKHEAGRFPADDEIVALLRARG
jgi:selenoprotein W-related protein